MAEEEYTYTVKTVNGKAVYTKVPVKGKTQAAKATPAPKRNLGCRQRYNTYAKERASKGHTAIGADKWMQINC